MRVLGKANEKTCTPLKRQGDHPIIWSNENFPKMISIGVGHDVSCWSHAQYLLLVGDALLWAKPTPSWIRPRAEAYKAGIPILNFDAAGRRLELRGFSAPRSFAFRP